MEQDYKLESIENPIKEREYLIILEELKVAPVCPISTMPDYGEIKVEYIPGSKCIEVNSLKRYLTTYKNMTIFNEDVTNNIFNDLCNLCEPRAIRITGTFRSSIVTTIILKKGNIE